LGGIRLSQFRQSEGVEGSVTVAAVGVGEGLQRLLERAVKVVGEGLWRIEGFYLLRY